MIKNIFFFCFLLLVTTTLCVAHTWIGWHTFSWNGDTSSMILQDVCGWHPAIASWILRGIFFFTDVHIYPFLVMQTVLFYLFIFIFIWALYCRWRTVWLFLLIFLFCTKPFYLMPLELLSTSFSGCWVLLLYSLTAYAALNPLKHKWTKRIFYTITGIVFWVALNSRQNAIIQVWPVTLIWIALYLNKKDLKFWPYLKRGIGYSFLSGIACIALFFVSKKVMTYSDLGHVYPATATFVHQIVGSCIPDMDKTCFDESWWEPTWLNRKDRWEELQRKYKDNKTNADVLAAYWVQEKPFLHHAELKGLHKKWVYAITKHPYNYMVYLSHFYKKMWFLNWVYQPIMVTKVVPIREFEKSSYFTHPVSPREAAERHRLAEKIKPEEYKITWSKERRVVGRYIVKYFPDTKNIYYVVINFVLFFIGVVLWSMKRQNKELLLLTGFSFSGVLSCLLIPLFTPAHWIRYTYPMCFCATVSLLIFIPLVLSKTPLFFSKIAGLSFWKKEFFKKKSEDSVPPKKRKKKVSK